MPNRAWTLQHRPEGMPRPSDFALVELPDAPLGEGELRVRNLWLSVDPYMRGRMNDVKSYVPPFQLGKPMDGGAIGEVVESNDPSFQRGERVQSMLGWREEAVGPASAFAKLPDLNVPDRHHLSVLGMPGATAYFGLLDVAEAKQGDTVFVSGAAGAVGSVVCQLAHARGMRVVASAGGPDKCGWLKDVGVDEVIDYKAEPNLVKALARAAPDGIDVYFDNVGGGHLDAALAVAKPFARFAICGMISSYNDGGALSLRFATRIIGARLKIRGFIVSDHYGDFDRFHREMSEMVKVDQLHVRETVLEGFEKTPEAFLGLFTGTNIGKMLVRV